jgi:hypothetical protein
VNVYMNRDKNFAFIEFRTGRGSGTVNETVFWGGGLRGLGYVPSCPAHHY